VWGNSIHAWTEKPGKSGAIADEQKVPRGKLSATEQEGTGGKTSKMGDVSTDGKCYNKNFPNLDTSGKTVTRGGLGETEDSWHDNLGV